jgi:small subunit ribosomal protein S17
MEKKTKKAKARNIGVDVKPPKKECNDRHCAFHGNIGLRGRTFVGTVISTDFNRTASVGWKRNYYLPKYERYEPRKSKVKAHNPDCIAAKKGDKVKVMECRPISKTKSFIIIEKVE